MTVSQPPVDLSMDFSILPAATAEAFQSIMAFIRERTEELGQGPAAFACFETELLERMSAVCRTTLRGYIEARNDKEEGPTRQDGQVFYRSAPTRKTINTLFGPVTFSRSRHRTHSGDSSFVPVDDSLGLIDGYLTIPAAYRALLVMDHCTSRDAAELFKKLGGMNPSASHLQRLSVTAGELWKAKGKAALDEIRKAGPPKETVSLAVSLDGVMIALRSDGQEDACWREASCGTVSFHDKDGKRLDTLYFSRMPELGKVTLKTQITEEVACIRKARPDLRLVAVADAAVDNWTFLEGLQPDEQIVDFFHACEHLSEVSDQAVASDWYEKYRAVLRDDEKGIDKVIRAIRYLRGKAKTKTAIEVLERELRFFCKHRHRMRYASLKAKGYAIGSGVVEAANKVLVNQRMKRSGMRWSIEGGQNILTFRALIRSGRFDQVWEAMVGTRVANDHHESLAA